MPSSSEERHALWSGFVPDPEAVFLRTVWGKPGAGRGSPLRVAPSPVQKIATNNAHHLDKMSFDSVAVSRRVPWAAARTRWTRDGAPMCGCCARKCWKGACSALTSLRRHVPRQEASRVRALALAGSRQLVGGRVRARHDLPGRGLHPPGSHDFAALPGYGVLHEVFLDMVCILQVDAAHGVCRGPAEQIIDKVVDVLSTLVLVAELVNNLEMLAESGTISWRT